MAPRRTAPRGYIDLGIVRTPAYHLDLRLRAYHGLGLRLPFPCTRKHARALISEARAKRRAVTDG